MKKVFQIVLIIGFAYALIMAVMTLQYFFDRGDMKRASKVIYEYKPEGTDGRSLTGFMAEELSIQPENLFCETAIRSRFEGKVSVECGEKKGFKTDNESANFQWLVDVVGGRILAQNTKAQALLNSFSGN